MLVAADGRFTNPPPPPIGKIPMKSDGTGIPAEFTLILGAETCNIRMKFCCVNGATRDVSCLVSGAPYVSV